MPSILFDPDQQFFDADGKPLAGGTISTYVPNTTTPKQTWQDHNGTAANSNPIVLDSAGRALMFGDGEYRLLLRDAAGNLIWDQYSATIVSAAMQPIVVAPTIADARRLLGADDAIAAEASARATADANEANWRIAADNALQAAIDNETGFRVAGDNYLQTVIDNETARAEAAEAALSAQIAAIPIPGTGSSSVTRTGSSTTDASGNFTATWATFSTAFGSFSVAETDPSRPGAGFTTTSITLSSYSGTLIRSDNLYPTATSAPVVSKTFAWVATGT